MRWQASKQVRTVIQAVTDEGNGKVPKKLSKGGYAPSRCRDILLPLPRSEGFCCFSCCPGQLRVEQRVLEIVYRKVDNLVRDFDEGSVAVIGAEVTEQTIENTIKEAYARGIEPVEVDLSDRLERVAKNAEKIKEVLNISEAASRHVDVSSLLKDPTEVITTEDIRRFLEYAKEAGIGKGSVYSDFPSYYVQDIP